MSDWKNIHTETEDVTDIVDKQSYLKIKALEEQIKGLQEIIAKYKERLADKEEEIDDLKSVVLRQRQDVQDSDEKIYNAESKLNKALIEYSEIKKKLERAATLCRMLELRVKPLAAELNREKQKNASLREELDLWKSLESRARKECSKDFVRQLMALMGRK